MKTKADLLTHITALTVSGELEWRNVGDVYYSELNGGFHLSLFGMTVTVQAYVGGQITLTSASLSSMSLYELVHNRQPLPEWAQEVGE